MLRFLKKWPFPGAKLHFRERKLPEILGNEFFFDKNFPEMDARTIFYIAEKVPEMDGITIFYYTHGLRKKKFRLTSYILLRRRRLDFSEDILEMKAHLHNFPQHTKSNSAVVIVCNFLARSVWKRLRFAVNGNSP